MSSRARICPHSGANRVGKYLYGLPDDMIELQRDLDAGLIVLGGCTVIDKSPQFHCNSCDHDWGIAEICDQTKQGGTDCLQPVSRNDKR